MLDSLVRTYMPLLWGAVLTWLASLDVTLDAELSQTSTAMVTAVAAAVVYAVARAVERRVPWLGRLLLGSGRQPTYTPPATGRVSSYLVE